MIKTTIDTAKSAIHRIQKRAATYREQDHAFARWAAGYGVIPHEDPTQVRVYEMVDYLVHRGALASREQGYAILEAADRVASAGMWLVAHMTYAKTVHLDGRDLGPDDFKEAPEGHMGGSLNMVPAYTGYLAANALQGITRSWVMGQGHSVSAIDATNVLVNNVTPEFAQRYDVTSEALTRLAQDFYSYAITPTGRPESPVGSHVNPRTAGGVLEGGYLGFAELEYVHMPLPGERLVAFLSDGAFEEQRGSDWAPRWWRAEDSGLVAPIMIANGRRIDQRTTMSMQGGTQWLWEHLQHNGFDPILIDGRDPAAFAWAIFEMEERLSACVAWEGKHPPDYPVPLPYTIAQTVKGYGFPGAGTNRAHSLPLAANPARDVAARGEFNQGARRLWVPSDELRVAIEHLNNHARTGRSRERDHAIATRNPPAPDLSGEPWREPNDQPQAVSAMGGIDEYVPTIVTNNPRLRPRVGNPDEMRSNRLDRTLDALKHRVGAPEPGVAESIEGGVITALNEEAVVCAALGNKGGLNLVTTYEPFGVKMIGAIRQELIFARHQKEVGRPARWIGIPVIATSHTWENGKNEVSHQDTTMPEALMAEMSDVSRVVFPPDWNGAVAALREAYASRGQIWNLVVPKRPVPTRLTADQAQQLAREGALRLRGDADARVLLCATGAYQLTEALLASDRLNEREIRNAVVYLGEPGRFRNPRDEHEASFVARAQERQRFFPVQSDVRVFLTHTRPEPFVGTLRPLDTGPGRTRVLGFLGQGGTLDVAGMLFANRSTWAHAVAAVADALEIPWDDVLGQDEQQAIRGTGEPRVVMMSRPYRGQPATAKRRA